MAQAQIVSFVKKEYGDKYAQARIYKTKSKNAQEAHEAIRPTHIEKLHTGHDDHDRLYRLIWERAVSSQMADAKLLKTKITAIIEEHEEHSRFYRHRFSLAFPRMAGCRYRRARRRCGIAACVRWRKIKTS